MDILDRISLLLNGKEQKELTNHLGLKSVAYSEWKSGKSKSYRKYLIEIAEFFNISLDYLVYGKEKSSPTENLSDDERELLDNYKRLNTINKGKVIGRAQTLAEIEEEQKPKLIQMHINSTYIDLYDMPVSAGTGVDLNGYDKEKIKIKQSPEAEQADFCLRISGDSMEPDYHDGDMVLVKGRPTISLGEIGIFIVNGSGYIKELGKNKLISLNDDYNDIIINEDDSVYCMGEVLATLEDDDIL